MRVISGTAKGMRLSMVAGIHVRPTPDRVKEAIFNVLGPFFEGGRALDLFAGAGGLGIEALSRGMDQVVFVDKSVQSIKVVRENLKTVKLEERAELYCSDARVALRKVKEKGAKFHYIFLDPPYHEDWFIPILEMIGESDILTEDGLVVTEHPRELDLPKEIRGLILDREFRYGNVKISLYLPES